MPVILGIAAIVALAISLLLRLAQGHIHAGVILTWPTFLLIGLLCWVVYDVVWWRSHRGGAA
jgi:uncharacterized membrane protein YdbT with pleckstrin-like domain